MGDRPSGGKDLSKPILKRLSEEPIGFVDNLCHTSATFDKGEKRAGEPENANAAVRSWASR